MKAALSVPRLLQCIDSWAKFINQSISIISIIRSMKNLAFVEVISGDCLSQHCEIIILALRKKWPLYCPQGSDSLRQKLLMMHGIAWYCMVLHYIA